MATENACGNVVIHANSAIAAALHDDERLRRAIARLRSNDFEGGELERHGAINEIARIGYDVEANSERGGSEVKRLQALASTAPGTHAADLRAFAEDLGGVLERQGKLAGNLNALLAALDFRDIRDAPAGVNGGYVSGSNGSNGGSASNGGHGGTGISNSPVGLYRTIASPAAMARLTATDLETGLGDIARNETRAAERVDAAVTGC